MSKACKHCVKRALAEAGKGAAAQAAPSQSSTIDPGWVLVIGLAIALGFICGMWFKDYQYAQSLKFQTVEVSK